MEDRTLDSLDDVFKPYAVNLLARCVEAGIAVMIINTRRTAAEQSDAVSRGVSWVSHSKHQDGLAIDIAPFDWWKLNGQKTIKWDAGDPIWNRLGAIGESVGLVWGGRWTVKDMGHFEMPVATPPTPPTTNV